MFGDLVVNLVAKINGFTRPMAQAGGVLRTFQRAASTLNSSIGGVVGSMGRQLMSVGSHLSGLAGGLTLIGALSWGVSLSLQAERAQVSFEVLLGNAGKARTMLSELKQYGRETGYGAAVQKSAETMLGFGVSAERVIPGIKAIGDIARGDQQRMESLSLAFAQSAAAGRLMGQDLLQMVNAGFNPLQTISKNTGVSITDLKKKMEDGQIPFDMVYQAFIDATSAGGQFHNMMDRISQTAGGQFNILKANIGEALKDIADSFLKGFDLASFLGGGVSSVAKFRETLITWQPTIVAIGASFREWFDWFAHIASRAMDVWSVISPWGAMLSEGLAVLAGIWATWSVIAAVVALVMNPVTWIVIGIGALAAGLGWVLDQFGGLFAVVEKIGFAIRNFGDLAMLVGLKMLLPFVSTFNAILFFFTDTMPAVLGNFWSNAGTFFGDFANYVGAMFQDLAGNLSGIFLDIWDIAGGGKANHQWKKLGEDFQAREMKPLELPIRVASGFEKGILDSIGAINAKLANSWANRNQPLAGAGQLARLDPNDPKYISGNDAAVEKFTKSQEAKQLDIKPLKLSGALTAGSREAYSSIVNAMVRGRGQTPAEKALAAQRDQTKEAKRGADELVKLNRKIDKNVIATIENLN